MALDLVAINDGDVGFGSSYKDPGTAISNTKDETGEMRTIAVTANTACYLMFL